MRCKAKAKRTGLQCNRRAVAGREVCQVHGGKTPRGIASPHYKHGRNTPWANILPKHMTEAFDASFTDPKLLSLRKDIALTDARITELLAALVREDAPLTWEQLVQAKAGFYKAQAAKNVGASKAALDAIMLLIDQGAADVDKWAELRQAQEHRRKMIETEWKSKTALARVLTMEQFANFIEAFKSVIITRVSSRAEQQALIDGVRELVLNEKILGDDDGDG